MAKENSEWDFFNEKESLKNTMVGKIKEVGMAAQKQKNWMAVVAQHSKILSEFSEYLGTNGFQTAFFIAVFYCSYFQGNDDTGLSLIVTFFATKQVMVMQHKHEIMMMRNMGLLKIGSRRKSRFFDDDDDDDTAFNEFRFSIPESVAQSIVNGEELKKANVVKTPREFLQQINKMTSYAETDDRYEFLEEAQKFEGECIHSVNELAQVKRKLPDVQNRFLFYIVYAKCLLTSREECKLWDNIKLVLDSDFSSFEQMEVLKAMISEDEEEQHELVKERLIEINPARMAEDATADTTNEGINLLFGENAMLYKRKNSDNVIFADKIMQKELFFSGATQEQLQRIRASLDEDRFKEIQERLSKKGMSKGIAALLYGAPGTGKTESVYQMAKESGRDIYHVDISQTRTKWYGESPKLVKGIFRRYKNMCRTARSEGAKIPILLLNEADALISTRKDVSSDSSVCDKEDNTIQNVVLEEMENFDGIMVATTNLATNMDGAFERRFLFKVEFKKPDAERRAKIWRSKIKSLNADDAKKIASDYDFSGGEIDNISRKMELEEVISGIAPSAEKIRELCQTEKIASESDRVIGFGAY